MIVLGPKIYNGDGDGVVCLTPPRIPRVNTFPTIPRPRRRAPGNAGRINATQNSHEARGGDGAGLGSNNATAVRAAHGGHTRPRRGYNKAVINSYVLGQRWVREAVKGSLRR